MDSGSAAQDAARPGLGAPAPAHQPTALRLHVINTAAAIRAGERAILIDDVELEDAEVRELGDAMRGSGTLEELRLFACGLTDARVAVLAEAAAACPSLALVAFPQNLIGPDGLRALVRAAETGKTLRCIHVAGNHVGDEGVAVLCDALRRGVRLAALGLDANGVTGAGVADLADALLRSDTLEEVYLSDNSEAETGVRAFASAVRFSATLIKANFFGNGYALVQAALAAPRTPVYREALAFLAAGTVGAARSDAPGRTPARRFVDACGDRAVLWRIVSLMVG